MQLKRYSHLLAICMMLFSLLKGGGILSAQTPRLPMEFITIEDGLPDNFCASMIQDRLGYIWIGTWNGLVRYDGYEYVHYRQTPGDTSSLQGKLITFILEDNQGNLWLGSDWGLHYFDRGQEIFTNIPFGTSRLHDNNSVPWFEHYVYCDSHGRIWAVSGVENNLHCWDPETGNLSLMPGVVVGSLHPVLKRAPLLEGPDGRIWLGTKGEGLLQFDESSQRFVSNFEAVPELGADTIYSLILASDEKLWLGTNKGLGCYDLAKQSWSYWPKQNSIRPVYDLRMDGEGNIWLEEAHSLKKLVVNEGEIRTYLQLPVTELRSNTPGYSAFRTSFFHWIGADNHGQQYWVHSQNRHQLFQYDPLGDQVIAYQHQFKEKSWDWGFNAFNVYLSGVVDHSGLLWLGWTSGLMKGKAREGRFINYS